MKLTATQFGALRENARILQFLVDLNAHRDPEMTNSEFDTVLGDVIKSLKLLKSRAGGSSAWDVLDKSDSILSRYEE